MKVEFELSIALRLAEVAEDAARLAQSHGPTKIEFKQDGSLATSADLAIEEAIAEELGNLAPSDSLFGEELGSHGSGPRQWIIDGIDNTDAFVRGEPDWGTLIACAVDGMVVAGVVSSVGLNQRWWGATGEGAWTKPIDDLSEGSQRLIVSTILALNEAKVLVLPYPDRLLPSDRDSLARLHPRVVSVGTGSWHHAIRVAEGTADVSLHFGGYQWDHAALVPIVEEAGGTFSDFRGASKVDSGNAVFSNGALHGEVLAAILQ